MGIKHVKQLKFKQGKDYNRFKAEYRRASDLCKLVFFLYTMSFIKGYIGPVPRVDPSCTCILYALRPLTSDSMQTTQGKYPHILDEI